MDIRLIDPSETGLVRRLWDESFDDNPKAFSDWFFSNKYKAENTLGLYTHGELVSTLQMIPYRFYMRGGIIDGASIAGVCTRADMRGKGYAKALMDASNEFLSSRGQFLATLYPTVSYDFYRRLGWEVCSQRLRLDIKSGSLSTCGYAGFDVRPCGYGDMAHVYEQSIAGRNLAAMRDAYSWKQRLSEISCDGGLSIAAYIGERPVAYAMYHPYEGRAEIDESASINNAAMAAVVNRLLDVYGRCTLDSRLEAGFHRLLRDGRGAALIEPFLMARCVDVAGLLSQLKWTEGPEELIIEVNDSGRTENNGAFLIYEKNGSVETRRVCGPVDISLGIGQLMGIVSGFWTASAYASSGLINSRSPERIDALFPPSDTAGFEMY